nr:hypothetical protein [Tanacetum cinerariifolium]
MRSQEALAEAPPSPDYVSSPEHSPSPDYMLGPEEPEQALLSSNYVPEPEYQRGSEENLEGDHANYPANGGHNDDDESSDDDDDDDVNEDDEVAKEEEEHLDLTNSTALHAIDPISSAKDKEAFETNESAPTPVPSPRRRTARMSIRPQIPMRACFTTLAFGLGREEFSSRRDRFTTPTFGFEVVESLAADVAARQPVLDVTTVDATPGHLRSREVSYGIEDVFHDKVRDMEEEALTTAEGLSERVTNPSTTLARDTHEIHVRLEDIQDNRALQRD